MFGFSLISIDAGKLEGPIILGMAGLAGYVLWHMHTKDQAAQSVTSAAADPNAAALATNAADYSLLSSLGLINNSGTTAAGTVTAANTVSNPAVYSTPATTPSATQTTSVGVASTKGGTV